jgi:hypothetical protein
MVSPSVLRIVIVVVLAAHGIAHATALVGLVGQTVGGASASHVAVRAWMLPAIGPNAAAALAIPFWLVAAVGFSLAALSFWGIIIPDAPWRTIAVASALVSIAGVGLCAGTWPGRPTELESMLDTGIATAMNLVILVTQLWVHWPSGDLVGR